MAILDHPSFLQPSDPQANVWRYMSLAKLIHLLITRSLWFSQLAKLEDPHEGTWPVTSRDLLADWYRTVPPPENGKSEHPSDFAVNVLEASTQLARNWHYVNCWCLREEESALLWQRFVPAAEGVCIRTRYAMLAKGLPQNIHLGMVRYADYSKSAWFSGNIFQAVLNKRRQFSDEHEVRAVYSRCLEKEAGDCKDAAAAPAGFLFPVCLETIVEEIRIPPNSAPWTREAVEGMVRTLGLSLPVRLSEIDMPPHYPVAGRL